MSLTNAYVKENNDENMNSNDSDLSDIGLCTVNRHEQQYNLMICHMMVGNYDKACEHATSIIENANQNYANKVWVIRGVLRSLLGKKEEALIDFESAKKNDSGSKNFLDSKKTLQLEVFPEENRSTSTVN